MGGGGWFLHQQRLACPVLRVHARESLLLALYQEDKTKAMQHGGVLGHTSTTAREQ